MDELIAFVKARLDDEEDAARGVPLGPWYVSAGAEKGYPQSILNSANILVAQTFTGPEVPPMEADYIARHNPARALREVAAKRLTLDLYEEFSKEREDLSGRIVSPAIAEALRAVIRADAAVWGDHPDYRQEWK